MINIKPKQDYLIALESVAMTDIVMNMFIFFFISFSLMYTFNPARVSKIDVRLPKAESASALDGSERATLAITRNGEYFIDDDKIKPSNLKKELKSKVRGDPALRLVLKVDGSAKFDNVAKALDIINELGIQKVSIAAVKEE